MNIFVAKLNFKTESEDLRSVFEQFGEVDSAKVILDHFTGKSRGFGFVEMPNEDEGRAAIEALNETQLDGNTIVVKKAEPRKSQGQGGGGGGRRDFRDRGGDRGDYRDRGDRGDYRDRGDRGDYRGRNDRNDRGGDRFNRREDRYDNDSYNRNRY